MSLKTFAVRARIATALILITSASSLYAAEKTGNSVADKAKVAASFTRLPLAFEANRGQADPSVRFVSRGAGYTLFLTDKEAYLAVAGKGTKDVVRFALRGSGAKGFSGIDPMTTRTNYFVGNDPAKWRRDIVNYRKAKFASVYPGIDLVYYGQNGNLEYDYVVAAGSNPSRIAFHVKGAKSVRIEANGDLVLALSEGDIRFAKPVMYQEIAGRRVMVDGGYALSRTTVSFKVGTYDHSHELVIDPVLNYGSYIGGSNASTTAAIAYDSVAGTAIVVGQTPDISFPPRPVSDACQTPSAGACNSGSGKGGIYVAKIAASGNDINFVSVIGGNSVTTSTPTSVAVDASSNIYVGGNTTSGTFPTTTGAIATAQIGGQDGVVVKLNSSGNLTYATYFGSSATDTIDAIAVNGSSVYVGGSSAGAITVPTAVNNAAFQQTRDTNGSGVDAYIAKLNLSTNGANDIKAFTYYGGDGTDKIHGIAVPATDIVYAVGEVSANTGFPNRIGFNGGTAFQATKGANTDGFIAKFDTKFFTGGSQITQIKCRDSAANGRIDIVLASAVPFVVGEEVKFRNVTTKLTGINTGTQIVSAVPDGNGDANSFSIIDTGTCKGSTNNDSGTIGSTTTIAGQRFYASYLGGGGNDIPSSVAVDNSGVAYVVGATTSTDVFSGNAGLQTANSGGQDGFIATVNATGTALGYVSFLGDTGTDSANSVWVDPSCNSTCDAFVGGTTGGANGHTVFNTNALQGTMQGTQDGFVSQIHDAGASQSFIFSTYVGGTGNADTVNGIAVDAATKSVYVTGNTDSTDLAVTASGYQRKNQNASTGYVAKLTASSGADPVFTVTHSADQQVIGFSGGFASTINYTFNIAHSATASAVTFNLKNPQDGTTVDYLTINSATPSPSGTCTIATGSAANGQGGVTCQIGDLSGTTAASVVVNATAKSNLSCPGCPASIVVPVSVAAAEAPSANNPGTDTATTNIGEVIDLQLAANGIGNGASPVTDTYRDGTDTSYTYSFTVTNNGSAVTSGNVLVTFTKPASFTWTSGCSDNTPMAGQVQCNLGTIAAGGNANATVTGSFTGGLASQTIGANVQTSVSPASTTQVFPSTANNNKTVNVSYVGPSADVSMDTVTTTAGPVHVGSAISITADYSALGGGGFAAFDGTVTFTFDRAFAFTGVSSSTPGGIVCTQPGGAGTAVSCPIGTFNPGDVGEIIIAGTVPSNQAGGSDTMAVQAALTRNSGANLINTGNDLSGTTISIIRDVALSVTNFMVTPNTSTHVSQAQNLTYSVDASNAGPDPATAVDVTFTLTSGYVFQSSATGCASISATQVKCTIANLAVSGSSTVSFVTQPPPTLVTAAQNNNTFVANVGVSTTAANLDTGATPSAGPLNTIVERQISLTLNSLTRTPATIGQTGTVTYTAVVQNNGPDSAQGVGLRWNLPNNYIFVPGSSSANCTGANRTVVNTSTMDCKAATIGVGAGSTVSFVVAFQPAAGTVPINQPAQTINADVLVQNTQTAIANVDGAGTKTAGPVATTVQRQSDISFNSFTGPATAPDGSNITYSFSVSNSGTDQAEGVAATITFSPVAFTGFSFISTTLGGGCSITAATTLTCSVGTVPVGGAPTTFNVVVKPPAGFLGGSASVNLIAHTVFSGNYVDGNGANDTQPDVTTSVQASADLAVVLTPSAATTNLSNPLSYSIIASNSASSSSIATNVRIVLTTYSNAGNTFSAQSFVAGANWSCGALSSTPGSTFTCTYGLPLGPGASTTPVQVNGIVNVPATSAQGNIQSSVTVDTNPASVIEANAADNTSAPVVLAQRQADLNVASINGTPNPFHEGVDTDVFYTVKVNNFGTDDATGVQISAAMPAGASFVSMTESTGTGVCGLVIGNLRCSNITLLAGQTVTVNVDIQPGSTATLTSVLTTNWSASSTSIIDSDAFGGQNNNSNSINVERHGDITLSMTAPTGPVVTGPSFPGNTVSYQITVNGDPNLDVANVTVTDVLPAGMSFVSTTVPAGVVCGNVVNTVTCTIASLPKTTNKVFTITGLPSLSNGLSQGTISNTVSATTTSIFDDLPGNNTTVPSTPNASTTLFGETDLQVSVSATPLPQDPQVPGQVLAGDDLRYDITVLNAGPHQSDVITLNHVLPAGTSFVGIMNAGVFSCPGNVLPCTTSLAAGNSAVLALRIHVPPAAVTSNSTNLAYQVTATNFGAPNIGSNTSDPNNANNNITNNTTARQAANMRVTIPTINPSTGLVQQNNTGTFTVAVDNISSLNDATGVTLTIPLNGTPATNSTGANASPSQGSCVASNLGTASATITCNLGAINIGAGATVNVNVTPTLTGGVQIVPAVTQNEIDPVTSNNSASASIIVGNTPAGANVQVHPSNSTTGAANNEILVTFGTVNPPGGNTSADPIVGPTIPTGYHIVNSPTAVPVAYTITTTATYSGSLACFQVGPTLLKPERVRVYAGNVDITVPTNFSMTANGGTVCGDPGQTLGGAIAFRVVEPNNTIPVAVGTGGQSQGTGKGLTGTGVLLNASASVDDSNACIVGGAQGTCLDLTNALITWTGQFTDANQKQVRCVASGGNATANPPQVTYPACLQLSASVPFGQQTINLQITDAYGATSPPAAVTLTIAGGASSGATNVTINPGQSATFGLGFTNPTTGVITLVANITPATNTIVCNVNPQSVPTGATNNSITLLCSTQGPVFAKNEPVLPNDSGSPMLASAVGITALPLVGILLLPTRRRRNKKMKVLAILGLILLMTLFMSACGGGGGSSFGGSTKLQSSGTPKGTYTVMVTGKDSSGNTVGSPIGPFTIVVQ